jgi:hypothetical protein
MSEHKPGPGLYVRREARAAPFYPARRKMAGACSLSGMPRLQSLFRAAPITLINMHLDGMHARDSRVVTAIRPIMVVLSRFRDNILALKA